MPARRGSHASVSLLVVLVLLNFSNPSSAAGFIRPNRTEYARVARWLVASTTWGVLSTLDKQTGNPAGGVVSHSDGVQPGSGLAPQSTPATAKAALLPKATSRKDRGSSGAALPGADAADNDKVSQRKGAKRGKPLQVSTTQGTTPAGGTAGQGLRGGTAKKYKVVTAGQPAALVRPQLSRSSSNRASSATTAASAQPVSTTTATPKAKAQSMAEDTRAAQYEEAKMTAAAEFGLPARRRLLTSAGSDHHLAADSAVHPDGGGHQQSTPDSTVSNGFRPKRRSGAKAKPRQMAADGDSTSVSTTAAGGAGAVTAAQQGAVLQDMVTAGVEPRQLEDHMATTTTTGDTTAALSSTPGSTAAVQGTSGGTGRSGGVAGSNRAAVKALGTQNGGTSRKRASVTGTRGWPVQTSSSGLAALQQKKKAEGDQQDGITSAAQGAGDLEDQQITPGYTYDYFEKLVKAAARRTAGVEGPAAEVDASTPGAAVGAVKAAAASTADAGKQAVGAATARVGSAAQAVKKGAAKAAGGIAKAGTTAVADATKAASAAAGSVTKSVAKAGEGAARAAGGLVAGAKAAAGSVTKSVTNSVARSVTKAGLQAVYPLTTGRLFFYLSPMDATTQNLLERPDAAYTLTEAQMLPGGCGDTDPEDPTCVKLTLSGSVLKVPQDSRDAEFARKALFSKHPDMRGWPEDHAFDFYELHVQEGRLLDWYGGAHTIDQDTYYKAQLDKEV